MEGPEVHGLSVGKKSSPKIDRDLREGKYLCSSTYRKERRRRDLASYYFSERRSHFLWKIQNLTRLLHFMTF